MLRIDSPAGRAASSRKIGLALAGGGPEGAIYEIGVLRALDEALEGVDLTDLHVYVGVSAGAFINANLVNDITTAQMCRAIVSQEPGEHPFVPETFFTPAVGELWKRASQDLANTTVAIDEDLIDVHGMRRPPRAIWYSRRASMRSS